MPCRVGGGESLSSMKHRESELVSEVVIGGRKHLVSLIALFHQHGARGGAKNQNLKLFCTFPPLCRGSSVLFCATLWSGKVKPVMQVAKKHGTANELH